MNELITRIRSVLRRRQGRYQVPAMASVLEFAGWQLDERAWTVRDPAGQRTELSSSEIRLLAALVNARGAVLTRDQLIDAIHGIDGLSFDRAIDIHVSRLRRKLDERGGGDLIRTVRGAGYSLAVPVHRG